MRGNHLSQFAPVILKTDVSDEDKLDQICVVTQPGTISKGDRSVIQSSMDLSKLDIDKIMSVNTKLKVSKIPERPEQLISRHDQLKQCVLFAYGDWMDTIDLLHHFRCRAEDIGKLKRSQRQHQVSLIFWSQWKLASLLSKSIKILFLRKRLQYLFNRYNVWKSAEHVRESNSITVYKLGIKAVMHKVVMSRIVSAWKPRNQLISRSKQLNAKPEMRISTNALFAWKIQHKCSAFQNKLMAATVSVWRSVNQSSTVQIEQKGHIVKTALTAWINKRRAAKSPSIASNLEFTVNTSVILMTLKWSKV